MAGSKMPVGVAPGCIWPPKRAHGGATLPGFSGRLTGIRLDHGLEMRCICQASHRAATTSGLPGAVPSARRSRVEAVSTALEDLFKQVDAKVELLPVACTSCTCLAPAMRRRFEVKAALTRELNSGRHAVRVRPPSLECALAVAVTLVSASFSCLLVSMLRHSGCLHTRK